MFLSTLFHPELKEFEEYDEFPVFEENFESFLGESLIGSEEWKRYLTEEDPQVEAEPISKKGRDLFKLYARQGSVVIDFVTGYGGDALLFSRLVGPDGKVLALASDPDKLRALFWNLVRSHVQNTKVYHTSERLDDLDLEDVSMLLVDAKGKEDIMLEGAKKTIQRCKPALLVHMLGGLSVENGDRYIKQEFEERFQQMRNWGYTTQHVEGAWYLALPKDLS
ncbi:MAG: hypothetical protein P0S96_01840 [Simkaniaceae bacterium]|nr:hypothetical protein [Candidatus Sacchlamyda saccharinae]